MKALKHGTNISKLDILASRPMRYTQKDLFPDHWSRDSLGAMISKFVDILANKFSRKDTARFFSRDPFANSSILKIFKTMPLKGRSPEVVMAQLAELFEGAVNWRSPYLQNNLGAAVNLASVAVYAVSLDANIFNIDDQLAGNAIKAEKLVTTIMANLAGVDPESAYGLFTFGGTGTNLYAVKLGLCKALTNSRRKGVMDNTKIVVTKDAHFCHRVVADWLGIGKDNVVIVEADSDRRTDMNDLSAKVRSVVEAGHRLATIIVNGGTTYDHVVDDIKTAIAIRDNLVDTFCLPYRPHLHIDSVIGWMWLMFKNYDWEKNPLGIEHHALQAIREQYNRICLVASADSWGVDFHKGCGGCPVDSSIFITNNKQDLTLLSKTHDSEVELHQLALSLTSNAPVNYTLETSRASAAPLSALAALHTLGQVGYQFYLSNLVTMAFLTRRLLADIKDATVLNARALGFASMIRLYPPECAGLTQRDIEVHSSSGEVDCFIEKVNNYLKAFYVWDNQVRMQKGQGVDYSFSKRYIATKSGKIISALKWYPTSPNIREHHIRQSVETLVRQKRLFDREIWPDLKRKKVTNAT